MRKDSVPFNLTPAEAARLPVFQLADAIEIANGCNTPRENYFAYEVARELGLPTTGGSDAHSESGIGYYATGFERELTEARRSCSKSCTPAASRRSCASPAGGDFARFEPGVVEAVAAARG